MSVQQRSRSKQSTLNNHHALSHVLQQWQLLKNQHKDETKPNQTVENYLQTTITQSFSHKVKYVPSFYPVANLKDRNSNKFKRFSKTKKKILFIEDEKLRDSSKSLEITKNQSYNNSKTTNPQKKSLKKLPQSGQTEPNKRHKSLPSQKRQSEAFANNEYIKRILKKFQQQSQAHQQSTISIAKSSLNPEFRRYSEVQCPKLQVKSAFSSKKGIMGHLSNKIKSKMHRKANYSDFSLSTNKISPNSAEISPWPILEDQP